MCTVDDTVVIVADVKGNGRTGVLSVLSAAESIATIVRLYTHYDDESESSIVTVSHILALSVATPRSLHTVIILCMGHQILTHMYTNTHYIHG